MNRGIKRIGVAAVVIGAIALSGCTSSADRVNQNLSEAAENFEVQRTIVFYNGITEAYIAAIEGRCSVENDGTKVRAICKVGPDAYERHEIGLADNVTYFALQTETADVSDYKRRIVLKPGNTLPDFDVQTGEK